MIINMTIIYSFLYFYVLCFLLVLPFIYLFQVHNLTLARCFLLALKLWRKSEIIEFVLKFDVATFENLLKMAVLKERLKKTDMKKVD